MTYFCESATFLAPSYAGVGAVVGAGAAAGTTVAAVSVPTGLESATVGMPRLAPTAMALAKTTAAIEPAVIKAVRCFIHGSLLERPIRRLVWADPTERRSKAPPTEG